LRLRALVAPAREPHPGDQGEEWDQRWGNY
jgi:hypothetical protein